MQGQISVCKRSARAIIKRGERLPMAVEPSVLRCGLLAAIVALWEIW